MAEISMAFGDFFSMKINVFSRLLFFVELIFGLIGLILVLVILKMYSFWTSLKLSPHIIYLFKMTFFPITLELSQILMSFLV
jgi:hypothetical protein